MHTQGDPAFWDAQILSHRLIGAYGRLFAEWGRTGQWNRQLFLDAVRLSWKKALHTAFGFRRRRKCNRASMPVIRVLARAEASYE
jgi:hypothetical protein